MNLFVLIPKNVVLSSVTLYHVPTAMYIKIKKRTHSCVSRVRISFFSCQSSFSFLRVSIGFFLHKKIVSQVISTGFKTYTSQLSMQKAKNRLLWRTVLAASPPCSILQIGLRNLFGIRSVMYLFPHIFYRATAPKSLSTLRVFLLTDGK